MYLNGTIMNLIGLSFFWSNAMHREESLERHVVLLQACFRKFNAIDFDKKRAFRVQYGDSLIRAFVIVGL